MTTVPDRKTVLYFIALAAALAFVWFTGPARPTWAQGPGLGLEAGPEALTPTLLSYQGRVIMLGNGQPITDGMHTMVLSIYDAASGGNQLWTVTKPVGTSGGVFSTLLGEPTPLNPTIFDGRALWLGVDVDWDGEGTPRQQILPVAYALGLAPGAVISSTSVSPAFTVKNAGTGNALRVEGTAYVAGSLTVGGNLIGGAHNHDDLYINTIGPDAMSGKDTAPILSVAQSGGGTALLGETASTANESAGLMGVAGWTSTALNNWAGVYGKSRYGLGVAGISDSSAGVWGQSSASYGLYGTAGGSLAAVYGTNTSSGTGVQGRSNSAIGVRGDTWSTSQPGVYGGNWGNPGGAGVQGYSQYGWSGYFNAGGLGALYANGPATVAGTLTTQKVTYSTPRTHYFTVAGNVFVPRTSSLLFDNGADTVNGGACITSGSPGPWELWAPVTLPDGATITEFRAYFNDPTGYSMTATLVRLKMSTGGYDMMASAQASLSSGFYSVADTTITTPVVDNTTSSYAVYANFPQDNCSVKVMGARITYTLSEAE
jgi:hypothetical protein